MGGSGKSERREAERLRNESRAMQEAALKEVEGLSIPDIEKMKIKMQMLSDAGYINAEQLEQEGEISTDPALREAQMQALSALRERGQSGLTEEDKAMQNLMLRDVAAQEQAQQKGLLQGMAERGALDSGAQLAAQLSGQQSSYNRAYDQAQKNAIAAAQAKREALAQAGNMAQGMEQSDFARGQNERGYRQAIDQFNLQNRMAAQQANLGIRQGDIGLRNQEQTYNTGLMQQDYNNRLGLSTTKANARLGQASNLQQQANAAAQAAASKRGSMMGTIGTVAGGIAGAYMGNPLMGAQIGGQIASGLEDGGLAYANGGVVKPDNTELEYIKRLINTGNQNDYIRDSLQDRNVDQSILDKLNMANNKRVQGSGFNYTDLPIQEQNDDYLNLQDRVGADFQNTDKNKLLDELEMLYNNRLQNGGMAQKYYSDGSGEVIPGDSYSGDRIDAKLNSGEAVINIPQQQRLMDVIRGKEDLTALGDEDIIEGVPESYRNKLHGKENKKDTMGKGFQRLLEMLGK